MVAVSAACGHSGHGRSEPVPAHLSAFQVAGLLEEYTPSHWVFQVLDSHGELLTGYDGEITITSGLARPISPTMVTVSGGTAAADLIFGLGGGDDLVTFSVAGVSTSQYLFIEAKPPERVAGPLPTGAVLGTGGGWDSDGAWAPSALSEAGGFKMYYSSSSAGGPANIGLATSTDGVHWTRSGTQPVVGPAAGAATCHTDGAENPSVRKTSTGYEMFYRGIVGGRAHLCRATSVDCIAWTITSGAEEDGSVLAAQNAPESFDNKSIVSASVVELDDSSLATVYAAYGTGEVLSTNPGAEHVLGWGVATSPDGLVWTRVSTGLLGSSKLGFAESPFTSIWHGLGEGPASLLRDGPYFRLWVTGSSDVGNDIGYYTSNVIDSWGADVDNDLIPYSAVIFLGDAGRFDEAGASFPSAVDSVDGVRRIYYTGLSSTGTRSIGLAIVPR